MNLKMEEQKSAKKIIYCVMAIIIIIGAIVCYRKGFNVDLQYSSKQKMIISNNTVFDKTKVEEIANSLKDLQAKVGDGIVKSVTYDEATGRLTVVSTSGTVTYSTHQTIPTYSVELRNNELFVNNES